MPSTPTRRQGKMLSRDSGSSELALCIINNLNVRVHTDTNRHIHAHMHTLLLSNAKNTEINTILSASLRLRSTIYIRGRADNSPNIYHIFSPCRPVFWEKETGSCAPQGQQKAAVPTSQHSSPTPPQRGPFIPFAQCSQALQIQEPPQSPDPAGFPHMETESDTGYCLVTEGQKIDRMAFKDPQTVLPQWGLSASQASHGVPRTTDQLPHKHPAANGHV